MRTTVNAKYHILSAGHKVNAPAAELRPVIRIMASPIHSRIADIVQRSAVHAVAETALELAPPVCELHVRAHVRFALAAANWPRLAKINNLHVATAVRALSICCSASYTCSSGMYLLGLSEHFLSPLSHHDLCITRCLMQV